MQEELESLKIYVKNLKKKLSSDNDEEFTKIKDYTQLFINEFGLEFLKKFPLNSSQYDKIIALIRQSYYQMKFGASYLHPSIPEIISEESKFILNKRISKTSFEELYSF